MTLPVEVRLKLASFISLATDRGNACARAASSAHGPDKASLNDLAAYWREEVRDAHRLLADDDDERTRPVDLRGVFPETKWENVA